MPASSPSPVGPGTEPIIPEHVLSDRTIAQFFSALHAQRLQRASDVDAYDLPHLSGAEVVRAYQRIAAAEREWVAPTLHRSDYRHGTARYPDEVGLRRGTRPLLITAEHATIHLRTTASSTVRRKAQDLGTAGLGAVLAEDFDAYFMVMRGRQTGDANLDSDHVFKDKMAEVITANGITTVISLHGMGSGKFGGFDDPRAYDILLGLGNRPSRESESLSRLVQDEAARMDLRCAANEWFVKVAEDEPLTPQRNADGTIAFHRFIAPGHTTRATAQRVAKRDRTAMAAVQVELSDLLRFVPPRIKQRSTRNRMIGTFLGYEVLRRSLASVFIDAV
jgi:hypothetical protein